MANTTYITKQGDRWDIVAFKAYGDALRINEIIAANPNVSITDEIAANTILNIPFIPEPTLDAELLPPWKR
jgi:nucleoid-associated protein YgaU